MKVARILFRCDASTDIGYGHLKRCLNLALWLRGKFDISFCIRRTKEAQEVLKGLDFDIHYLKKDATAEMALDKMRSLCARINPKVVINDIKDTTTDYMQMLKVAKIRVVNFDDLGEGAELADAVIDANRRENKKKLFGPKYVVLHSNYAKARNKNRSIHKRIKNIVISIGGADPFGITQKLLECFEEIDGKYNCVVVLGPLFKNPHHLQQKWKNHEHIYFIQDLDTVIKPLLWADCAITNGGITMFESLCLGTPTLIVSQNADEVKNVKRLERKEALLEISLGTKLSTNKVNKRLKKISENYDYRVQLSTNGKNIVDGRGIFRSLAVIEKLARKR